MFILGILLFVHIVCGNNAQIFPEVGVIADRCEDVAVQSSSTIFSMVLKLKIPTLRVPQWHCNNGSTHLKRILHNNIDGARLTTWLRDDYSRYLNLPNNNYSICIKRFILPLISIIGVLAAGIYSAIKIQSRITAQALLRNHLQNLQTGLQEEHHEILEITTNTKQLYTYLYTQFLSIADKINSIQCDLHNLVKLLSYYIVIKYLQAKMYAD